MSKVCVIGGGASGMMAAVSAAMTGAEVTLFERGEYLGKKIYATGNGKCNFSNLSLRDASDENIKKYYRGTHPLFAKAVISSFGPEDTVRIFNEMGLYSRSRGDLLYPHSDQAASVVSAFERYLSVLGVDVRTSIKITGVKPYDDSVEVILGHSDGSMTKEIFDSCVLCCGGRSYPKSGSDGFGYKLCKKLSIPMVKVAPALTKLICRDEYIKSAVGARWQGSLTLSVNGDDVGHETGEIQFTEDGISGIVAFQLSSIASRALVDNQETVLKIDFCPELCDKELTDLISEMYKSVEAGNSMRDALCGFFNNRITDCLLEYIEDRGCSLFKAVRSMAVVISDVGGYDGAQTCTGGIDVSCLTQELMVRDIPRVFAAGELLDIDGLCGGFNLQFAFSSGFVAGRAAGRL